MTPQGVLILVFVTVVVGAIVLTRNNSSSSRKSIGFTHKHKGGDGVTRELLMATKGDRALAQRLLNHVRQKHPGKSQTWYIEKVLYDLERDGAGGAFSAQSFRQRQARNRSHRPNPLQSAWNWFQGLWNPRKR